MITVDLTLALSDTRLDPAARRRLADELAATISVNPLPQLMAAHDLADAQPPLTVHPFDTEDDRLFSDVYQLSVELPFLADADAFTDALQHQVHATVMLPVMRRHQISSGTVTVA